MHHPVPYCCRFAFTLLLLFTPATCFSWPAKVVSVNDGDTITVLRDGRQVKIRLYGIDSPEKGQDFGLRARDLTAALVAGRNVDIEQMNIDLYGRIVGLVEVNGQSFNNLIVQNGFASRVRPMLHRSNVDCSGGCSDSQSELAFREKSEFYFGQTLFV